MFQQLEIYKSGEPFNLVGVEDTSMLAHDVDEDDVMDDEDEEEDEFSFSGAGAQGSAAGGGAQGFPLE